MPINKNTMEVTRKVKLSWDTYGLRTQEENEAYLNVQRRATLTFLEIRKFITLNDVFEHLNLRKSREGLTLGWEYDNSMTKENLFTWAFYADDTVEVTFHNLKDITNLYKTEEELV